MKWTELETFCAFSGCASDVDFGFSFLVEIGCCVDLWQVANPNCTS